MAKDFTNESCREFVSVLSSAAPVPGGGGAAALVGSIGAALANMVGSLTVGKKTYAAVEPEVKELMEDCAKIQEKLLACVEKDAAVFEPLSKAYSIPKDDPAREPVMEAALREAVSAPVEIMELCILALPIAGRLSEIGSKLAVSDAGCAAACLRGALNSAALNVFINTKSMKDRKYAEELNEYCNEMLVKGTKVADEIYESVKAKF